MSCQTFKGRNKDEGLMARSWPGQPWWVERGHFSCTSVKTHWSVITPDRVTRLGGLSFLYVNGLFQTFIWGKKWCEKVVNNRWSKYFTLFRGRRFSGTVENVAQQISMNLYIKKIALRSDGLDLDYRWKSTILEHFIIDSSFSHAPGRFNVSEKFN